ncbi:MAG: SprT family zinc-dependent metalloprotease [Paracoccaceae bacterium]
MRQIHLPGDPEITVEIRVNTRARRLSLRVSQLDGRVTMTLPKCASASEARGFACEKEHWIRCQLGKRPQEIIPRIGGQILLEGQQVPIVGLSGRAVRFQDGQLQVPGDADRVPIRTAAYLKTLARERLSRACDHYSGLLGVDVKGITMRDTRSRWGSCTTDGKLMFSWRLIMAPKDVLDYVAAHEVAHLLEMNHSPPYWAVVAGIYPGYKIPRQWLRKNGAVLHSYRFAQLTTAPSSEHIMQ